MNPLCGIPPATRQKKIKNWRGSVSATHSACAMVSLVYLHLFNVLPIEAYLLRSIEWWSVWNYTIEIEEAKMVVVQAIIMSSSSVDSAIFDEYRSVHRVRSHTWLELKAGLWQVSSMLNTSFRLVCDPRTHVMQVCDQVFSQAFDMLSTC